jgi:hypothetical protein
MFLAAASSILFGIIVAVLIAVPFEGAMTRLRAQYAPKSISLDGEEARWVRMAAETNSRTNPELKGVFHSLRRTIALEGWSGVYKGGCRDLQR